MSVVDLYEWYAANPSAVVPNRRWWVGYTNRLMPKRCHKYGVSVGVSFAFDAAIIGAFSWLLPKSARLALSTEGEDGMKRIAGIVVTVIGCGRLVSSTKNAIFMLFDIIAKGRVLVIKTPWRCLFMASHLREAEICPHTQVVIAPCGWSEEGAEA
jgi:hypothetical protein